MLLIKGGFSYFSLGGGAKISGGVVMIMCRGGSRVFDDRFTRFTQLIGGSGGKSVKASQSFPDSQSPKQ